MSAAADKQRVVIVEDDESIRRLIEVALSGNGYDAVGFNNAADALENMKSFTPDVAIFDIMMDGMDGLEAVSIMRKNGKLATVPVIMLTARDTEADKIVGLDNGADDYMTKPFSVLELCARVRAQLRRNVHISADDEKDTGKVYEFGTLKMDDITHEVYNGNEQIELTLKEYELLKLFMNNPGRVLSRTEILEKIWGGEYFGETRTLDIHIGTLRHKLGDSASNYQYIKTIRGVGYRFLDR